MSKQRRAARRVLLPMIGLALAIVSAPGCTSDRVFDEPQDPPGRYLERTSPGNVLRNVEQAFHYRDLEGYRAQLHQRFTYEGSPGDAELPSFDVDVIEKFMINVERIEASIIRDETDVPSTLPEYPASEGYRMIDAPSLRMDVTTRQIVDGEPLIYQIAARPFTFVFAPDPGADTWRLVLARHEGD